MNHIFVIHSNVSSYLQRISEATGDAAEGEHDKGQDGRQDNGRFGINCNGREIKRDTSIRYDYVGLSVSVGYQLFDRMRRTIKSF